MKVIILEDTITYAWEYEMVLEKLNIKVIGIFKSWKEALPIIKNELPDFLIVDLFLDNNEKGLDFIKQMKNYFIPTIVCTAYPEEEYMEEALEAGVKAFLSKPIDKTSLSFQIKKLVNEIESQTKKDFFVVKDNKNLIKIPYSKIYKIEVELNYSCIYVEDSKKFVIKLSLRKLEEKLNDKQFFRCHRSTIVNINYVKSMDTFNNKLLLKNGKQVDVGNKFKAVLKKAILN